MTLLPFQDRAQAAQTSADAPGRDRGTRRPVLGTPRGGMPMARFVADALASGLDMVLARKPDAPRHPARPICAAAAAASLRTAAATRRGWTS